MTPPSATEIIPDLEQHPLALRPRPDRLRILLTADCFALFGLFGLFALAALLTSHDWLRLPDTVIAVAALIGALRYLGARTF